MMQRRKFFEIAAAAVAGSQFSPALGEVFPARPDTVRDRLWVFCNPINADYGIVGHRSVISPLESAIYLGIPNIEMVNQYPKRGIPPTDDGFYQAWRSPFELYAYPLKVMRRVVWSIVGASGKTNPDERRDVIQMARRTPNIAGISMDDFFRENGTASLTPAQLQDVQKELKTPEKKLDLYVTLYTRQINANITDYLNQIDVITLWTWETAELENLEANLLKLEKITPKSRKILGCYTTAYHAHHNPGWTALPVPTMRKQCELGLRWLQEGRIEGIMIYGNFLDLGWDVIGWTRDWIDRVGDATLSRRFAG
jgi:hypothetical protein